MRELDNTPRRRRGRLTAALAATAAIALCVPTLSADARGLASKPAAVAAAKAQVRKLASQTHASSSRVNGCKKSTAVRYVCQVETDFRTGARRCTADVVVSFKSGRARTSYSNYVCY